MSHTRLSVVVTIVEGEKSLQACLQALREQNNPPPLEVIVPFDASSGGVAEVACKYPECTFVPLGNIDTEKPIKSPAGQHELFDKRRSAGLNRANGEIIAILEDRGIPDPDWAASVDRLHQLPYAVIGGAVECGVDRMLNWAIYFCDFGRYQLPFIEGPRAYLTDVNISYKRNALLSIRDLWQVRYHETTVNWALTRCGETLFLTPELVVRQMRENLRLSALLRERFHWGRLFAYTRARESTPLQRILLATLAPILPIVLFVRHLLSQMQKRAYIRKFVLAAPTVLLLLSAWSLGEMIGYITSKP